ncbi:ATP-binding cassette domain-containing protein [Acidocella sp.]|uniref:ATP-binding cassette domain-containing protein n=1 Tax=Acidocella sp. TaxID=50710 RepID=UPI002604472A|nr:ATP-binding cassette domain-containing protein [Acidocella sp.]
MSQDARHRLTIESLRNVSFTLDTGDRRGFIGSNGAGKTTLLSIMVGIYEPAARHIGIDGAVTSIAGPGSGTNFELTGNAKRNSRID